MSFAYQLMGSGYRLGRFLGIDVRLNQSWFVAAGLLLLVFTMNMSGAGLLALPLALALVLLLFGSVLAHEYGHALAARSYGIRTRAITLHGLGGLAQIESEPRRPADEIVVAAAGPAVSFVLGGLGLAAWVVLRMIAPPFAFVAWYIGILNLILGAFNLLPGMPLDGGRILRGILWARGGDRRQATLTASSWGVRVGQGLMILGVLGMFGIIAYGGFMMLLVGLFVYTAAKSEKRRLEAETRGPADLERIMRAWSGMTGGRGPGDGGEVDEVVRFPDGREVLIRKPRR